MVTKTLMLSRHDAVICDLGQANILQCDPPSAAWDPVRGVCTPSKAVLQNVVVNVFHLIIDLFLLLLPVPVVLRLRTDRKKKRKFFTSRCLDAQPSHFPKLAFTCPSISLSIGLPSLYSLFICSSRSLSSACLPAITPN